jgi:acetoin utilization deacetylase AcuC-like enzyme
MTLLYYDPVFMEHQTGSHPESAARVLAVVRHLNFVSLDSQCTRPHWRPVSVERLGYVHSPQYVESVRQFAESGGGYFDADTIVSKKSYEVARMAVGAVCDAVERVVSGEDHHAFCLVRPPGHHAMPDHAMGFCLFNNVAVGARVATKELGIERVLIVDFDVHHGNGTQAIFWEHGDVGYFSIHRCSFYPGSGGAEETGSGAGAGWTVNLPIEFGMSREEQVKLFQRELMTFAELVRPQLVLISAGFDSHEKDPIGSLGLQDEDFEEMTAIILDIAKRHAGGKVVSVLEGGYDPETLAHCIATHVEALLSDDI